MYECAYNTCTSTAEEPVSRSLKRHLLGHAITLPRRLKLWPDV